MERLTRIESQARTRELLLVTAQRLFLRDGFVATSLDRVAAEAGYSKGAVYSNFGNKDDLCLEVLDRVRAQQAEAMLAEVAGAESPAELLEGFRRWAERNIGDEPWTLLEVEFATASRSNPRVRAEIARRRSAVVEAIAGFVEQQAQRFDVPLPLPAVDATVMGLSLGIGLGVQRAVDPSVGITALTDFLAMLLGVAAPDVGGGGRTPARLG